MSLFLFDLDGTLIDSNSIWREVDRAFLNRRGLPYTHAYFDGVAHTIFPVAAQFTKDYCKLEDSCESIMAEWMELAREAYAHTIPIKPGVRAYLKQCRTEGRRMAIVTSSIPAHCMSALKHLSLEGFFEHITFAQTLGLEKKDPALYLAAAAAAGMEPERCTVFDDSLNACRGARAARMRVIGVYDKAFGADEKAMREFCDLYLQSFEELLIPEQKSGRK